MDTVNGDTQEKVSKLEVKQVILSITEAVVVITVGGVLGGYLGGHIRKRELNKLKHNISISTFQKTITWFDDNFDNLDLRGLWDAYAKENPEKIIYQIK